MGLCTPSLFLTRTELIDDEEAYRYKYRVSPRVACEMSEGGGGGGAWFEAK